MSSVPQSQDQNGGIRNLAWARQVRHDAYTMLQRGEENLAPVLLARYHINAVTLSQVLKSVILPETDPDLQGEARYVAHRMIERAQAAQRTNAQAAISAMTTTPVVPPTPVTPASAPTTPQESAHTRRARARLDTIKVSRQDEPYRWAEALRAVVNASHGAGTDVWISYRDVADYYGMSEAYAGSILRGKALATPAPTPEPTAAATPEEEPSMPTADTVTTPPLTPNPVTDAERPQEAAEPEAQAEPDTNPASREPQDILGWLETAVQHAQRLQAAFTHLVTTPDPHGLVRGLLGGGAEVVPQEMVLTLVYLRDLYTLRERVRRP